MTWLKSLWQDDTRLRRLLIIVDLGLIAFWAYTVAYINAHPADKGSDGFEIFLAVPMTMIVIILSLPALLLLLWKRTLRLGAGVTLAAIVTNAAMWSLTLRGGGLGHTWLCSTPWTLCW